MNLLKHKSWHVLGKDNVAKVRKDEKELAMKEEEEERRKMEAERQFRLGKLRERAADRYEVPELPTGISTMRREAGSKEADAGHLNLFEAPKRANEDYEQEKKEEQAKEDKLMIMSLNRPEDPWYASKISTDAPDEKKESKERKRKTFLDPIAKLPTPSVKKSHSERSSRNQLNGHISQQSRVEKMKNERAARESQEKARTEELFRKKGLIEEHGYNGRFNPEITDNLRRKR